MGSGAVSRIYRWTLFGIAFILPSGFYGLIWLALSIIFLCWLQFKDYKNIGLFFKSPQILYPVLLYVYVVIGFFFSHNYSGALASLSTRLPFLLFPLIIGTSSIINERTIEKFEKCYVIAICFFLILAIGYAFYDVWKTGKQTILINESIYNKYHWYGLTRVFENWHPTYVALFSDFAVAILLRKIFKRRKGSKLKRIVPSLLIILFLGFCVYLLNSITAIIAFFSLIIFYTFQFLRKTKLGKLGSSVIIIAISTSIAIFLYENPMKIEKIEDFKRQSFIVTDKQNERNAFTIRLAKWEAHRYIIKDHWLFGTTDGDINEIRKQTYIDKGFQDLAKYNYNAHNQYIETLASFGVIGLFILLYMMTAPILSGRFYQNYIPFILILSIGFLTESILNRQQGILYFMFMFALYTNQVRQKNKNY
ncbi:MAG TPA: O-antigen ligase family protein [Flavisolibacter sp.]|nr:O-antigen ligase family protein [Flavisolibacter sp.]